MTQNPMRAIAIIALAILGLGVANPAFAQAPGSLDPTFGTAGQVVTSLGTAPSGEVNNVILIADGALQSNGDILLVAYMYTGIGVVRYLPSGALDKTFGTNGLSLTTFGNYTAQPAGIALQSNGQIVVAASGADGFAVERLNTNGSLDTTFGTGGQVTTSFSGSEPTATAVLIQPNGKIVVAGYGETVTYHSEVMFPVLARYNTNGTLDTTFGSGGTVVATGSDVATAVIGLDANGDIFVLDYAAIAEFSSSGVLDSAVTPATITAASGHGTINAFYSNGEYLASDVVVIKKHDQDEQVVRYTATGAVDTTFSNPPFDFTADGSLAYDYGGVTILSNGQIMVGGYHEPAGFTSAIFGLARLNSTGALDTTFGTDGTVTTTFTNYLAVGSVTLVQSNGDIILAGTATPSSTEVGSVALARYIGN